MHFLTAPRTENPKQAQTRSIAIALELKHAIVLNGL